MLLGLPVLAPIFREEFDLTLTEVGIVLASVWVGPIFTLLPWGLAADRYGERLALAVGLTAMGLLVGAAAAVDDFYALVALLGLASAAGSSVNSASGRAVMHWFGAEERGFALGLRQASLPLGGAFAAVTLPSIVGASSLDGALVFLAVLCLVAALVSALVMRDRPAQSAVEEPEPWTLRDRRLWLLSARQQPVPGRPDRADRVPRPVPARRAAALDGRGRRRARRRAGDRDRVAHRRRPLVGPCPRAHPSLRLVGLAIFATLALSAALLTVPLEILIPTLVVATAFSMMWNGLSYTAAAELAGRTRSGAAIGFQQMTLSIVGFVAAPLFAALVDASSWRTGFAVFAAAPLAGWWVLGQLAPED